MLAVGEAEVAVTGDKRLGVGMPGISIQDTEALPSGEGSGVMSSRGPTPGEDMTEAGDSDPPVKCAADKDLTLELRTGNGPAEVEGAAVLVRCTWSGEGILCEAKPASDSGLGSLRGET
jgi:hypothetical protein